MDEEEATIGGRVSTRHVHAKSPKLSEIVSKSPNHVIGIMTGGCLICIVQYLRPSIDSLIRVGVDLVRSRTDTMIIGLRLGMRLGLGYIFLIYYYIFVIEWLKQSQTPSHPSIYMGKCNANSFRAFERLCQYRGRTLCVCGVVFPQVCFSMFALWLLLYWLRFQRTLHGWLWYVHWHRRALNCRLRSLHRWLRILDAASREWLPLIFLPTT